MAVADIQQERPECIKKDDIYVRGMYYESFLNWRPLPRRVFSQRNRNLQSGTLKCQLADTYMVH